MLSELRIRPESHRSQASAIVLAVGLMIASAPMMSAHADPRGSVDTQTAGRGLVSEVDDLQRKTAELFEAAALQLEQNAALLRVLCDQGTLSGDICVGRDARIVFVTSSQHFGNLPNAAAADLYCNVRAQNAGLNGYFKAWISDAVATAPATTFVQSTVPYKRVDGAAIADNWNHLVTGPLSNPINRDEKGAVLAADTEVWTSTNSDGTHIVFDSDDEPFSPDCDDWSVAEPTPPAETAGWVGRVSETDEAWSAIPVLGLSGPVDFKDFLGGLRNCSEPKRLYCFEQ
jgi:hypothetical protein